MLNFEALRALIFIAIVGTATFADQPQRTMPVVPSEDVLAFDWKHYPIDRIKSDSVDLSLLPENVRALQGQRIRVRGYMLPGYELSGIRKFILNSYIQMTFGQMPCDAMMVVNMEGDTSIRYSVRPVTLEGTLTIDEWMIRPKQEVLCIYRLHDAKLHGPIPHD